MKLNTKEKILSFIINNDKLLLLLGSDKDPQFHESFWYVVTGSVEKVDKLLEDCVKREIKEETNLDIYKIIDLNEVIEYDSLGCHCIEHLFISFTNSKEVILNEESIDYKWCSLDEFIQLIKWYDDKNQLKEKLIKYIKL